MRIAVIAGLALFLSIGPAEAQAAGRVTACAIQPTSTPLPGVTFVAWSESAQFWAVADGSDCVVFPPLPAGTYTVVGLLPGFAVGVQGNVRTVPGSSTQVELTMKLAPICECLDGPPRNLREMWDRSTTVVRLGTEGVAPPFEPLALNVKATVLQVLKPDPKGIRAGDRLTITFQPVSRGLRLAKAYAPGSEIVAFLPSRRESTNIFDLRDEDPWVLYVEPTGSVRLSFRNQFFPQLEDLLLELRKIAISR
jgi:hypothetical protein